MRQRNRIRQVRAQAGMTMATLAREIQRCEGSLSLYERGLRDLPLSILNRIAQVLQVSPHALLPDDLEEESEHGTRS